MPVCMAKCMRTQLCLCCTDMHMNVTPAQRLTELAGSMDGVTFLAPGTRQIPHHPGGKVDAVHAVDNLPEPRHVAGVLPEESGLQADGGMNNTPCLAVSCVRRNMEVLAKCRLRSGPCYTGCLHLRSRTHAHNHACCFLA